MHLVPFRISFLSIAILSALGNLVVPFLFTLLRIDFVDGWNFQTVWIGVMNGLLIGEFVAVAFWMMYDPLSLLKKLLFGTFVGLLLAACLVLGMQVWPGMPMVAGVFLLIVGSVFPSLFACLLYGAKRITMLKKGRMITSESQSKSRQYGIGFLMLVMAAVALAITLIRSVLPTGGDGWLSSREFVCLAVWFGSLSIGVTLFIWFPFRSVLQTTWFNLCVSLVLAIFGPSLFGWFSGFMLIGRLSPGANFKMFDAVPQCMSFGLLTTSLLLGTIIRLCVPMNPPLRTSAGVQDLVPANQREQTIA